MPPRLRPVPRITRLARLARLYSTASEPLIRVTNIPAPSSGHIRVLELNRPQARNAISKALLSALRAQVDDLHAQYGPGGRETGALTPGLPAELGPTRALVLASAVDACFCAGADLKERRGFTQQEYVSPPSLPPFALVSGLASPVRPPPPPRPLGQEEKLNR